MSEPLSQPQHLDQQHRVCPFCGTLQQNHLKNLTDLALECEHCHQKTGTLANQTKALYLIQSLEGLDKKLLFSRSFEEMQQLSEQVQNKTLVYPVFLYSSIKKILKKKMDKTPLGKGFFLQIFVYFLTSGILTLTINELWRRHIHDGVSFDQWRTIQFWSPSFSFSLIFTIFLTLHLRNRFFRSISLLSIITFAIVSHACYTYFG
jgi:hypothetical protein